MRNYINLIAGVFLLIVVSGCASYKAYQAGVKDFESGEFDRSIQNFQKSVELSPKDEEYQTALVKAKFRASEYHYCYGQELFRETYLAKAKKRAEKALLYNPDNKKISQFLGKIIERLNYVEQCKSKALKFALVNEWDAAVKNMRLALVAYKTCPGGEIELERILNDASQFYVDEASKTLSKDEWDKTEKLAKKAKVFGKMNQTANGILTETANRRKAKKLTDNGQGLLQKKKFRKALTCFLQAKCLYQNQPGLDKKILFVKKAICKVEIAKGNKFFSKLNYIDALECYYSSKEVLNDYGNINNHIQKTRQKLAEVNLSKGKSLLDKGCFGNAFFYFTCASEHLPNEQSIKRLLIQTKNKIKDKIKYRFAFVFFTAQNNFNDLNDKLIQSTIKKAQKLCSKNVEIISSPKLGKIIPEKNFNFKQWLASNDHLDVLNGIDGLIISSLDSYAITSDKTETSGTANYIEGTRLVHNPDYKKAKQDVMYALKMVKKARRELSFSQSMATMSAFTPPSGGLMGAMNALSRTSNTISVGVSRQKVARAEAELMTAQTILSNTPYRVEVPNQFTVTYPIYMVQATSRLLCSFKAFDMVSRKKLGSRMISGSYMASDRYIAGNPRRNIPNDPLVLPNQGEFAIAALSNASGKINDYLETVMSQHGKRFIYQIEKARKNRDMEKMIENCVYYILSYPNKAASTPKAVTTLNRILGKESRLINLEQGLHRRE